MSSIAPQERASRSRPCKICNGFERLPRGEGRRCTGFEQTDDKGRLWVHCSREEYAAGLPLSDTTLTYAHLWGGPCNCGVTHEALPASGPLPIPQRPAGQDVLYAVPRGIVYDYQFETGAYAYSVIVDGHGKEKQVGQGRIVKDETGRERWQRGRNGTAPLLYRQNELARAPLDQIVLIVEGERDVETLRALGYLAVCNVGGAGGGWQASFAKHFAGREVVALPDRDEPGAALMANVERSVGPVAARMRILPVPGDSAKDVTDLFEAGFSPEEFRAYIAPPPKTEIERFGFATQSAPDLLAEQFPPVLWLVPGMLSEGCTLLVGSPKVGKTLFMLRMALDKARGGYVLGTVQVEACDVLYFSLEDGPRRTQRRLQRMNDGQAVPENFRLVYACPKLDAGLPAGIEAYIDAFPKTRLVVIDTLSRVRTVAAKNNNLYQQDYETLAPLSELANRKQIAIVVVYHTRKGLSDDPMDMVSGTQGMGGSVDSVQILSRRRFAPSPAEKEDEGEENTILTVMGRDMDEDAQFELRYDPVIGAHTLIGRAESLATTRERQQIWTLLDAAPGGKLTRRQLVDLTGKKDDAVRKSLTRMIKAGELRLDGYTYARITPRATFGEPPPAAPTPPASAPPALRLVPPLPPVRRVRGNLGEEEETGGTPTPALLPPCPQCASTNIGRGAPGFLEDMLRCFDCNYEWDEVPF